MNEPKLFTIFKNSFVHVVCKDLRSSKNRLSGNVVSEGFLTTFDDEYFFFSMEPMGDITEAIRRDNIIKIYLPINELYGILESQGSTEEMM